MFRRSASGAAPRRRGKLSKKFGEEQVGDSRPIVAPRAIMSESWPPITKTHTLTDILSARLCVTPGFRNAPPRSLLSSHHIRSVSRGQCKVLWRQLFLSITHNNCNSMADALISVDGGMTPNSALATTNTHEAKNFPEGPLSDNAPHRLGARRPLLFLAPRQPATGRGRLAHLFPEAQELPDQISGVAIF
jgi:hypothetical protein